MSSFSIEWHKTCLGNWTDTLAAREDQVAKMQASIARDRASLEEYRLQIAEAERRGLAIFDAERFLKRGKAAKV